MSSKSRKVEKNELLKLLKNVNQKMDDFSDSVQLLKDLKDSLEEVDEELAERERTNKYKLEQLNKDFVDNKIRAVNQAANELNKVLISKEELQELKDGLQKMKNDSTLQIEEYKKQISQAFEAKLEQALNVQKLTQDCETANLRAEVQVHQNECANLKETLKRMSDELDSQKELTSSIANVNRRDLQRPQQSQA